MNKEEFLKQIHSLYIDDLKEKSHHSVFIDNEKYKILILRGLKMSHEGLEYTSFGFIIDDHHSVYQYNQNHDDFILLDNGIHSIVKLVHSLYQESSTIIDSYINEVDDLEDSLFERTTSRIFMDHWFDLKKDMAKIERHFLRSKIVFNEFYNIFGKHQEKASAKFRDLLEQIKTNHQKATVSISRIDALYNYYTSLKNEKLNKNIYMLTLVSAIFLPLNLIVGFFGMNTSDLPLKDETHATELVLYFMGGILVATIFGLPIIRFIDQLLIRSFLNKNDIYKKMSSKFQSLLHVDKL